jgi:copper chaperone
VGDEAILTLNLDIGVESIETSLEKQTVVVDTNLPRELILETIKKTGKTVTE